MSLPIIDEATLRSVVSPDAAVAAIRAAFAADGHGRTRVPAVINLPIPDTHGEFHVKTAWVDGAPIIAVKVASGFYENPARGLPSGSGLMALFDAATGLPQALFFDNGFLTDIRTGAAGAVAAELLARADATTVGVIGSGVQARFQVQCLRVVRPITRILAWSPDAERRERYCREMRDVGLDARVVAGPEDVCRQADVVITTTPAREPLVRAAWLRPGQHVTAVGSDTPGKQELEAACLGRADRVVVDRLAQCAAFGELAAALRDGVLSEAGVWGTLGEIAAGRRAGRSSAQQLTVCDLTGVGFQDTAIAAYAWSALSADREGRP